MCPPPSDPIWPIRPVFGPVYVPRAEYPGRVRRRERHEDEGQDQRRRREQHEPQAEESWHGPLEEAAAGAYDDHGRSTHPRDDEDPPEHRHVDAVA